MKLVAVQLVLIAALILTLNITLTLGQNDVTLLENEEDDNVIEKDTVSQNIHEKCNLAGRSHYSTVGQKI